MRESVIGLTVVIGVALEIVAVYKLRMLPSVRARTPACSASLISGGSSYKVSGSVCLAEERAVPFDEHLFASLSCQEALAVIDQDNPEKDGRGAAKGNCVTCNPLTHSYRRVLSIRAAQHELEKCASS
jgi:hypothetical protein